MSSCGSLHPLPSAAGGSLSGDAGTKHRCATLAFSTSLSCSPFPSLHSHSLAGPMPSPIGCFHYTLDCSFISLDSWMELRTAGQQSLLTCTGPWADTGASAYTPGLRHVCTHTHKPRLRCICMQTHTWSQTHMHAHTCLDSDTRTCAHS